MILFDSARRYLNDKPMLISFNANVVPFLMIFPDREENKTRISAMVPASGQGRYESRSVSKIINTTDIPKILDAYRLDPENTLETLFDLTLVLSEPSDNDLARSIRKAHDPVRDKAISPSLDDRIASIELLARFGKWGDRLMGTKNDPGQFDCYENALPDEPKAQVTPQEATVFYQREAAKFVGNSEVAEVALKAADLWMTVCLTNRGRKKAEKYSKFADEFIATMGYGG